MHKTKRNFAFMAIAIVGLLAIGAAYADNIGSQNPPRPIITKLAGEGSGLAVSTTDSSDFGPIKIVAAKVKVFTNGNTTEVEKGAIEFNDKRLKLGDLVLGNSSVQGSIYRNNTQVGSLNISSVVKNGKTFWYGTMSLDGKSYNLYIVGLKREIKADELQDRLQSFCQNNISNPICTMGGIGRLCSQNPNREDCKKLFRESCLNNTDDERCRTEFQDYCQGNSTLNNTACQSFEDDSNEHFCKDHSNQAICQNMMNRKRMGQGRGGPGMRGNNEGEQG